MKVTVVGSGHMGSAFARRLSEAGHEVTLTSRNLDEARQVAQQMGSNVHVESLDRAASQADVIIAATPYPEQVNAIRSLGNVGDKVVIDISNPLKPDMSGLAVSHDTSAAEEIAKALPRTKIVKAFNTVFSAMLAEGDRLDTGKPVPVFFAGDDENAKKTVRSLIESMGFEAVDSGPLMNARNLEPMGFQNIWFGFQAKQGTHITPAWERAQGNPGNTPRSRQ